MKRRCAIPVTLTAALLLAGLAGCDRRQVADQQAVLEWDADCPPLVRPAPLSLDAAREAYRAAESRHELRLREAARPGAFLRALQTTAAREAGQDSGLDADRDNGKDTSKGVSTATTVTSKPCLSRLAETGQLLFDHEFSFADGLGSGDAALSPLGPFRRVHEGLFGAPETISCPSCHWVGGPNGAGAETDNAFLDGDGTLPGTGDARNPPALVALGVVEALAREMTAELQAQRDDFVREAAKPDGPRKQRLESKGVRFGVLRLNRKGKLDLSGVEGIDEDLVVKPFGWKGTRPDISSFSSEALQVHLGIQTDDLVALGPGEEAGHGKDETDPDGDGVRDEFGRPALAALTLHLALLELPIVEPLVQDRDLEPAAEGLLAPTTTSFVDDFARGRKVFHDIGCASCHRPMMVLENPVVEIDGLPAVDVARAMRRPALEYDEALGGYPVWLFSDLKRHDMGAENAAQHEQRGVALEEYLTPRLWGVADSAPYLHDGRAPSFDYAIAGHGGEGEEARAAFFALEHEDRNALRVYLISMRRAPRVMVP